MHRRSSPRARSEIVLPGESGVGHPNSAVSAVRRFAQLRR
jgi:hypothetical protein